MRCQLLLCVWMLVCVAVCLGTRERRDQSDDFDFDIESFYLAPDYRNAHVARNSLTRHPTDNRTTLYGVAYCVKEPPTIPKGQELPLTDDWLPQASTCPWYWQLSHDKTRTPALILTAKCSCQHCQGSGPHSSGATCKPIHYYKQVVYNKGTPTERHALFRVAAGCTCERMRVRGE